MRHDCRSERRDASCYHLGNQYLFRSDIRTVHVAMFESDSFRRFLGQRMTEAVVKQIANNDPANHYRTGTGQQFFNTGRIITRSKGRCWRKYHRRTSVAGRRMACGSSNGYRPCGCAADAKTIICDLIAAVTFIPEGGQSITTAQQQLIQQASTGHRRADGNALVSFENEDPWLCKVT